jgi:hypothetical protein
MKELGRQTSLKNLVDISIWICSEFRMRLPTSVGSRPQSSWKVYRWFFWFVFRKNVVRGSGVLSDVVINVFSYRSHFWPISLKSFRVADVGTDSTSPLCVNFTFTRSSMNTDSPPPLHSPLVAFLPQTSFHVYYVDFCSDAALVLGLTHLEFLIF